jgi:predicted methyltransferase
MTSGPLGPPGSADMVITARNIHNWLWVPGQLDKAMKDFHAVLKPGGILAVEEHRADPRPMAEQGGRLASDGYVSTKAVIEAATKAGFKLDGQSEVNANPKDKKDHPFGVWTLPPTNRVGRTLPANWDPAVYKAVGESDRMTLRFKKA